MLSSKEETLKKIKETYDNMYLRTEKVVDKFYEWIDKHQSIDKGEQVYTIAGKKYKMVAYNIPTGEINLCEIDSDIRKTIEINKA